MQTRRLLHDVGKRTITAATLQHRRAERVPRHHRRRCPKCVYIFRTFDSAFAAAICRSSTIEPTSPSCRREQPVANPVYNTQPSHSLRFVRRPLGTSSGVARLSPRLTLNPYLPAKSDPRVAPSRNIKIHKHFIALATRLPYEKVIAEPICCESKRFSKKASVSQAKTV
jgi:hypothetical protein